MIIRTKTIIIDTLRKPVFSCRGGSCFRPSEKTKYAAELPAGDGALVGPPLEPMPGNIARHASGKHVEFIVQFRTHEWYQEVAKAMRERAQAYGATFTAQIAP